jgi:hypothetical protein
MPSKIRKSRRNISYVGMDSTPDVKGDTNYQEQLTPKKLGYEIEKKIITKHKSHCCGDKLIPAKYGQKVYDCKCKKCGKKIQIKSTSKNIKNKVIVTKASERGTCDSPVSIYKIIISKNSNMKIQYFSPDSSKQKPYYSTVQRDIWGNPILELLNGTTYNPIKLSL